MRRTAASAIRLEDFKPRTMPLAHPLRQQRLRGESDERGRHEVTGEGRRGKIILQRRGPG